MKLALVLASLVAATSAQAADLNCNFKASLGNVGVTLADTGEGVDKITFKINDQDVGTTSECRAENSFRTSAIRCPVIVNRETRLEFYRTYFERRNPQVKYSMVIWTKLSSSNPRVESVNGSCAE